MHAQHHPQPRRPVKPLLTATALVAVVSAAALGYWYWRSGVYSTDFGEQRTLTLEDGSVITLNTESRIRVRLSARERVITLTKGEVFFQVAHDARRPFWVSADGAVVRAVGTQFNIRIAPVDTVVSVVEGVVKVTLSEGSMTPQAIAPVATQEAAVDPGNGLRRADDMPAATAGSAFGAGEVILNRGQEALIERHAVDDEPVAPAIRKRETALTLHSAEWTLGRYEFAATSIRDVLTEFKRYRRFRVQFGDADIGQVKITGSFDTRDPEAVLDYIGTIPGISVERTGPQSYSIRHN